MTGGPPERSSMVEHANRLWYVEGRPLAALAQYQAAAKADPTDPVVQYQLARALWAFRRYAEARACLALARRHEDRLSTRGRELLAEEERRLAAPSAFRHDFPVPENEIDADRLAARDLSVDAWLAIGSAADERGMYGLAVAAYERAGGVRELYEDAAQMESRAMNELNRLAVMGAAPDRSLERVAASIDRRAEIAVEASVAPGASEVSAPVWLTVALLNRGTAPALVNARMLFNAADAPHGEVSVVVHGPPGYANNVQFFVRAGDPEPKDFEILAPGAHITRRYDLHQYESLHLSGQYRVVATYSNRVRPPGHAVEVFSGIVRSNEVAFERTAPFLALRP